MIVFKVTINSVEQTVALEEGVFNVIADRIIDKNRSVIRLHVGGLNTIIKKHVVWTDRKLQLGDKISIEVAEEANIESIDKPTVKPDVDQTQFILKSKLKSYQSLKKELEEKGLI